MSTNYLDEIARAQKRGETRGIYSICSAHPIVLEAAMRSAAGSESLLIESTCNQVNQFGGYTGMTPSDFVRVVHGIADEVGFPKERLIVGGDHLGPLPWRTESGAAAMEKAKALVLDCVQAGYIKIHLDASVPCMDDQALSIETIASRTAALARVAEQAGGGDIRYVVGSEVPPAGGAYGGQDQVVVTSPVSARETLEVMRQAFREAGLGSAWERVVALVVQPGVEFGNLSIHPYQREKAAGLRRFIESVPGIVYEAHSTDYQNRIALSQMVEDHFAILKVGPELTFAFREAVFALEMIEQELGFPNPSRIGDVLESAMMTNPVYWESHYRGSEAELRFARRYGLSDRIRYYWAVPEAQSALSRLLANLEVKPIPVTLLSQFMLIAASKTPEGEFPYRPRILLMSRVGDALDRYRAATNL